MHNKTLLISAICLLIGFVIAYFIFENPLTSNKTETVVTHSNSKLSDEKSAISNPFSSLDSHSQDNNRLNNLENEISLIKQQLQKIQLAIQEISASTDTASSSLRPVPVNNRFPSALSSRLYSYDNLIKGGIDSGFAEDIIRRKNSIELKRLELQDRATRGGYLNTQRYYNELADINRQQIKLRDELGDDQYDEYLYNSRQNNRIKIISVMLGSSAEQAGIKKGDIVLSYDNKRMFTWRELKEETAEGQLGEYVSISIYRNGEVFSFSVPRGPLGTQLGATRLAP